MFYISTAMPKLKFEKLDVDTLSVRVNRSKVPGGWLVIVTSNTGSGATFYPDPEHKWNGGSVTEPEKAVAARAR